MNPWNTIQQLEADNSSLAKQAILKELDPTEVRVVERCKWVFLRYGKTIKGKRWDSWQVEVGAASGSRRKQRSQ